MAKSGLMKYQHAKSKTKQFAKSGTQLAKEYEEYVGEYYDISRKLRKGGVKVQKGHKQGLGVKGQSFQGWERTDVLSIGEFKRYKAKYGSAIGAKELALKQYNLISDQYATTLAERLKEAAQSDPKLAELVLNKDGELKYSLEQIKARQLPDEVWSEMTVAAESQGMTNSQYYFGSL